MLCPGRPSMQQVSIQPWGRGGLKKLGPGLQRPLPDWKIRFLCWMPLMGLMEGWGAWRHAPKAGGVSKVTSGCSVM